MLSLRSVMCCSAFVAMGALFGLGCEDKLEEKECDALRATAFEAINGAHNCNTDDDCKASSWPGCEKPVSQKNLDQLSALNETFTKGKCEEPAADCREPPAVYCKQGLCTFREDGADEDLSNPVTVQ